MASLAQRTDLAAWIDCSLDYLLANWNEIPDIAKGWEKRQELDRLDFVLEWPLRYDRLHQLRRWNAEGQLSPAQQQRLRELESLMRLHQATLDRLLTD